MSRDFKVGDRCEVLCEAVSQVCHEEPIRPHERTPNNKGKKKHWFYDVVFRVLDPREGPFAQGTLVRLTFQPLDAMDRYAPGTQWDLPLWYQAEVRGGREGWCGDALRAYPAQDPTRILHCHVAPAGTTDVAHFVRTPWQLMAVVKHGGKDALPLPDRPVIKSELNG